MYSSPHKERQVMQSSKIVGLLCIASLTVPGSPWLQGLGRSEGEVLMGNKVANMAVFAYHSGQGHVSTRELVWTYQALKTLMRQLFQPYVLEERRNEQI
jgi:hypothetical protein